MKIIFDDGFSIQSGTGIGNMTSTLFNCLKTISVADEVEMTQVPHLLAKIRPLMLRRGFYLFWLNTSFQRNLKGRSTSVVHFTNYLLPLVKSPKASYVATIHDLGTMHCPDFFPFSYTLYSKWTIFSSILRADLIITYTQFMKEEITRLFNVPPDRVQVIPCPIDDAFYSTVEENSNDAGQGVLRKFGIRGNYLLFVGKLEKRKNILTLLRSFKNLKNQLNSKLVLVGKPGFQFWQILNYMQENAIERDVVIIPRISLKELICLYDRARLLVFPSFYEGFGLPLAEAMARGLPVVASRIPVNLEVAGGGAIYYGEPSDADSLSTCVSKLFMDEELRNEVASSGLIQAKKFSPDQIARQHLALYRKVVGGF